MQFWDIILTTENKFHIKIPIESMWSWIWYVVKYEAISIPIALPNKDTRITPIEIVQLTQMLEKKTTKELEINEIETFLDFIIFEFCIKIKKFIGTTNPNIAAVIFEIAKVGIASLGNG